MTTRPVTARLAEHAAGKNFKNLTLEKVSIHSYDNIDRSDLRVLEQRVINQEGGVYNEITGQGNKKLLNSINAQAAPRTGLTLDPDDPADGFHTYYPGCSEPTNNEERLRANEDGVRPPVFWSIPCVSAFDNESGNGVDRGCC
jgi:hypothetical protein